MSNTISLDELCQWLNNKCCEISLSHPKPLSEEAWLYYTYETFQMILRHICDPNFMADSSFGFKYTLTRELIRREKMRDEEWEKNGGLPGDESWKDILMLQRCIDILKEFDRFIERIGGHS